MKMTVMCMGPGNPHASWVAIDELAYLLADLFDADLLSPKKVPDNYFRRQIGKARICFDPVNAPGGDVLMVVAHGPFDLAMIKAVKEVKHKYRKIYGFVTDSYFANGFPKETALFDALSVTAFEDIDFVRQVFGIPVHLIHQGTDTLRWAPRQQSHREIDLIAFGRTPHSYHKAFQAIFHDTESPNLYLHSPLGHLSGPDIMMERAMLFKLLHRTNLSLAFHLYVEPVGDRPRSMMVTSRWLESLVSGCIVVGKRPVSSMADSMLNWRDCTIELPDDAKDAVGAIQDLIKTYTYDHPQRTENIRQMIQQHDWRHRIVQMCEHFDWPIPAKLTQALEALKAFAQIY